MFMDHNAFVCIKSSGMQKDQSFHLPPLLHMYISCKTPLALVSMSVFVWKTDLTSKACWKCTPNKPAVLNLISPLCSWLCSLECTHLMKSTLDTQLFFLHALPLCELPQLRRFKSQAVGSCWQQLGAVLQQNFSFAIM